MACNTLRREGVKVLILGRANALTRAIVHAPTIRATGAITLAGTVAARAAVVTLMARRLRVGILVWGAACHTRTACKRHMLGEWKTSTTHRARRAGWTVALSAASIARLTPILPVLRERKEACRRAGADASALMKKGHEAARVAAQALARIGTTAGLARGMARSADARRSAVVAPHAEWYAI